MSDIYKGKKFPGSEPFVHSNEYPTVDDINYEKFILTAEKMPDEQKSFALKQFEDYIGTQKKNFMGYQANQEISFSDNLAQFLDCQINNIGDPFQSGNFTVNSKVVERAVLDYFASLWNAKWPHQDKPDSISNRKGRPDNSWRDTYWGYVLSMGSSEGNIYALWNARDYLSGKFLLKDTVKTRKAMNASRGGKPQNAAPRFRKFAAEVSADNKNAYTPIAFYSENTHYSIVKNMRILGISTFYDEAEKNKDNDDFKCPLEEKDYPPGYSPQYIADNGWPYEVPSNEDGTVYIPALVKLVDFFAKRGYPPMIIFNYGSTFKGALDNVKDGVDALVPVLREHGLYKREVEYGKDEAGNALTDRRTGFWIHVDGALGAGYVPFLRIAKKKAGEEDTMPVFDFSIKELHSITMSGHKWIGAPWPCGIFMSKVKYQLLPVDNPAYIGASDSTFSGSRNGFSSLILWDFISRHSVEQLAERARKAIHLANYFCERFKNEVVPYHKDMDLWLERSSNALTIRFRKVNESIVFKYSLSNESLYVNGEQRDYSHIFLMDLVSKELVDRFIESLKKKDAFTQQNNRAVLTKKAITSDDADSDFHYCGTFGLGLGFK